MIERCFFIKSESVNPYYNLALEEHLFRNIPANSMIFYLWRNAHTVVIGKNQNAYKECHLQQMELDHCYLARRSSGGGAVYHDLGNLNFTFLMYMDSYDIRRQTESIVNALQSLGLKATVSGRNDIEVDGFKVSGNAYLTEKEHCLHHGTLLWNTDKSAMKKYLNVSDRKIQSKGVDSVESRVANLVDFNESITLKQLEDALLQSVANSYGELREMTVPTGFEDLIEHYHSYRYLYNTISKYTVIVHDYFSFGEGQIYVDIENNVITHLDIFTDALEDGVEDEIRRVFEGMPVDEVSFRKRTNENADRSLHRDLVKIYQEIRKYCYR